MGSTFWILLGVWLGIKNLRDILNSSYSTCMSAESYIQTWEFPTTRVDPNDRISHIKTPAAPKFREWISLASQLKAPGPESLKQPLSLLRQGNKQPPLPFTNPFPLILNPPHPLIMKPPLCYILVLYWGDLVLGGWGG